MYGYRWSQYCRENTPYGRVNTKNNKNNNDNDIPEDDEELQAELEEEKQIQLEEDLYEPTENAGNDEEELQ